MFIYSTLTMFYKFTIYKHLTQSMRILRRKESSAKPYSLRYTTNVLKEVHSIIMRQGFPYSKNNHNIRNNDHVTDLRICVSMRT